MQEILTPQYAPRLHTVRAEALSSPNSFRVYKNSPEDVVVQMRLNKNYVSATMLPDEVRTLAAMLMEAAWQVDGLQDPKGPRPVTLDENIGSCEPSPRIDWDKTGTTWHTDTKAGRYSVRRMGKRQPFGAFLNNTRLTGIPESTSIDVIKRDIERRIIEARRIANMSADDARKVLT